MTPLRRFVGLLVLLLSRGILWIGTKLSWGGWWLMDREDMIVAQQTIAALVEEQFVKRGKA